MSVQKYLPSTQFSLLIFSVAIAGGLVFVAKETTEPSTIEIASVATPSYTASTDWKSSLQAVQAESGVQMPQAPDENTIEALRKAAISTNLTESVSRTLLVNLGNAKAQGLGNDIPTQEQIITSAVQQIDSSGQTVVYTKNDLIVVADSEASQRAYGNALAIAVSKNQVDSFFDTMVAVDNAASQNNPNELKRLPAIAAGYRSVVELLLDVPVPQTMLPFHVRLVNNFQQIADSYTSIEVILNDPLRGLSALKDYQTLTDETLKVFINIAQILGKNGILFTKDEPGSAWAALVSIQ